MISRSVQFEENEMAMSPEGAHDNQTKPQQDWLMYPVANDAQRDDSADLDDNQDVFDEPEEIPDVDVEPEYLPVPAAVAEGEEIPRDEFDTKVMAGLIIFSVSTDVKLLAEKKVGNIFQFLFFLYCKYLAWAWPEAEVLALDLADYDSE
uniref:Uncharacterized protein n=1 Tax=Sphaerodactylus townsendi TaxID=933632 RepID=A0ACB8E8D2_9SAUR